MSTRHYPSNRIVCAVFLAILVTLVAMIFLLPSENLSLGSGELLDLNDGWTVETGDRVIREASLPLELNLPPQTLYRASRPLPPDFPDQSALRIRASMQDLRILLDGQEVFSAAKPSSNLLTAPDASVWHLVDLPAGSAGKLLTLELRSPAPAFSGTINPVYAGSGVLLLTDILKTRGPVLLTSLLLVFFGALMVVISFFLKNMPDRRVLYLGMVSILVGLWIFTESRMTQLFTGNRFLVGGLAYSLLPLIPIPFILFMTSGVLVRRYRSLNALAVAFPASFFLNIFLQVTSLVPLMISIRFTLLLMVLTVILLIVFLVREARQDENKQAGKMLFYLGVLALFLFVEIAGFFFEQYDSTSLFARTGLIIFLALVSRETIRQANHMLLVRQETELLKVLAFRDIVTGGGNRAAFEKHMDQLMCPGAAPFRLILMDINDLKMINDRFGHQAGDEAIRICSRLIGEAFGASSSCFRLGGDEFACTTPVTGEDQYLVSCRKLESALREESGRLAYPLSLAMGSGVYVPGMSPDPGEFFHRTDRLMYEHKRRMKMA